MRNFPGERGFKFSPNATVDGRLRFRTADTSSKQVTNWIFLVQINKFPKFLSEKRIGAPLTHSFFTRYSRPLRQNHYTTHLHDRSTYPRFEGMRHSGPSIDQHCNRRPRQFIATMTFKLQVRGPKTAKAGRKQDENRSPSGKGITTCVIFFFWLLRQQARIMRRTLDISKLPNKMGSNLDHPLTETHSFSPIH